MSDSSVLQQLMAVVENRRKNLPAKSYTTMLFQGGIDTIGCKVMEEAAEVVRAARKAGDSAEARQQFIAETADVLYHVLVLLGFRGVPLCEVEAELARRFGISGLDEKASRNKE